MPPGRQPIPGSRDRQPGGTVPPPVRKRQKRKPKPNPFAGLPGQIDPKTGTVGQPVDVVVPKKPNRKQREIRRRQNLLRSAGYQIIPDGIWGPRSQNAWNDYLRRGKNILKPDARNKVSIAAIGTSKEKAQFTRAEKAAEKRRLHFEAVKKREKDLAMTRAAILNRAAQLKRNPRLAEKISLRELTDVLVDKEAKFDPARNEQAAKAIQWHLRVNGFNVPVTGRFDPKTYEALQRAFKVEQRRELQSQANFVRTAVYRTFREGDKPYWYSGKLPSAQEFVKQLQKGDFHADMMWRSILAEMERNPSFAWEGVKQQQLFEMAETLQPFGPGAVLGKLGGPESVAVWQYFADIISIQDMMPFGNYDRAGFTEEQRLKHLKDRSENEDIIAENRRRKGEIETRIKVLIKSTSAADFKNLYAKFMAVEDQKFKRFQQQLASTDKSWWGDALDKALAPGEFFRTSMWYTGMEINQTLGLHRVGIGEGADRDIRWEDALVFGGTNPKDLPVPYDGLVEGSLHPLLRFGYELTVDPLNFAHPFRVGSTLPKFASSLLAKKSTMGSYVLTGQGMSKAVVYERGSWSKLGLVTSGLDRLPGGFRDSTFARRAYEGARRLTQTKDEALGAISKRLDVATKLGWKKPKHLAPGEEYTLPKMAGGKIGKLLDDTDEEMTKLILELPQLKSLLLTMKRKSASLWVNSSMVGPHSQYGATLMGYMAETVRPLAAFHVADEIAVGRYRVALMDGLEAEAAQALAQQEYDRIMVGVGTFLKGGDDKALSEVEHFVFEGEQLVETTTRNVSEEVERRVAKALDDLDRIYFPQIQRWLVNESDAAFDGMRANAAKAPDGMLAEGVEHPMWDEGFRWRGRHDVDELVGVIRKSFDDFELVPNQRYGIAHTALEMGRVLERDIRIATHRLSDYVSRGEAAGTLSKDFDFEAALTNKVEELKDAWSQGEEGLYYDTRKQLEVSNLYTRHIDGLQKRRLTFDVKGEIDFLAVLGEAAPAGEWGGIEKGLFEFAAMVTRATEKRTVVAGVSAPGLRGAHVSWAETLGDAVERRRFALREAENAALRDELLKQGAVWRAFQHAQSRYARYLYKGLSAQLVLWKFATLALRPAWAVRNIVDNAAKSLVAGVRDPRLFMIGPGKAIHSVFDLGLDQLRDVILYLDTMFGTNIVDYWDGIVNMVWDLPSQQLSKLFRAHNIEVPPEVFEANLRHDVWDNGLGLRLTDAPKQIHKWVDGERVAVDAREELLGKGVMDRVEDVAGAVTAPAANVGRGFASVAWSIMGDMPENYFRRAIYRDTYSKALRELTKARVLKDFALLPGQVMQVGINGAAARAALEKIVGRQVDEVAITFNRIPLSKFDEDGWFESVADGTAKLVVNVPTNLVLRSREHAEQVAQLMTETFIHEARHARQFSGPLAGLQAAVDRGLPYRFKFGEMDARWFTKLKSGKGEGIFFIENELPSEWRSLSSVEIHLEATRRATAKVHATLFDYSAISVTEDNLRVFFPFIQFWRKNTRFWVNSFATKPWLNNSVAQFDDARRDAHGDLPVWMRRYFHTEEISDALAVVPGLSGAFEALGLGDGAQYDPVNMLSFAPFYRAFKSDSDFMPADRKGIAIIGPIIDALNDWGLGVSPFFRKPLEASGVASYRSWQTIWPQTSLLDVIGTATGHENLGRIGRSLERISALGFPVTDADSIADRFDYYVQAEIAGQVARGEEPNLEQAEQTIRDWFLVQNLWGYFGGVYWRRATPEDMYLAQLQDDLIQPGGLEWKPSGPGERKPNPREAKLLKLWSMRGYDRLTYESYLDLLPVIEAYYRGGLEDKLEILKDTPEIIRWVDGDYAGKPISKKFIRYAHRYQDQALFFDALEIADTLDLPHEMKQVAEDMFVSPEMKRSWAKNGTGKKLRERMIAGEAHQYHQELNKGYHSIPEDDFEAQDAFLNDHPELVRYWGRNNDPADDYEAIMGGAKASLRDMYFDIRKTDGFDGAADFLKLFPFMFEGTKSEGKVKDGAWIFGGGKWSAERARDFGKAKPHLNWFFDKFMKKVGEKKAWAWLEESETEAAALIQNYLFKWTKAGQARIDYMKALPWLKIYEGMPPAERAAWLRGDSEGAKVVRDFFKKYASGKGLTQHSKDFLAVKEDLRWFFDDFMKRVGKTEAYAWLERGVAAGDPRAMKLKDYFKKYGKQHQFERAFKKLIAKYPGLKNGTPEQAKRLDFWRQFFELSPDQRPLFVAEQAEKHGIFMYGEFGEEYRHDREQEFMRRSVGLGLSKKQSAYLYVKPLLDFYRTLDADEKVAFARANPEIQEYFDKYSTKSMTGDKKLDKAVEEYFKLPPDSLARSKFLREHPQVQDWFDKRNPAEGAMRNLLEKFFSLTHASLRQDFLDHHPEIEAYFERRREERFGEAQAANAFDRADPRLRPFYEDAASMEDAAARMRAKLRQSALNAMTPDGIEGRRERRPAA